MSTFFKLSDLLAHRQLTYQTDLTMEEIGQRMSQHVITGFSLYSKKPYYGDFTACGFAVRKTASHFKRQSIYPAVDVSYAMDKDKMLVTMSLRPHTVWYIALGLFGFPFGLFMTLAVPEFFRTLDPGVLLNGMFPALFVYGIFRVIFYIQSNADVRFWTHVLKLQELRLN